MPVCRAFFLAESLTWTPKPTIPVFLGVPVIAPLFESFSPFGSELVFFHFSDNDEPHDVRCAE